MHAYTHIYAYTHMCTTCSECVRKCVRWCKKHTCVAYTPAHALVPKTAVPKCMQHSLQKNAHIYTCTHIYTHIYAHEHTCACMTSSTRWSTDTETHNLCTNMHTHTRTHVYKRIHIHVHTHMHIYTYIHVRTHTLLHPYTYIHTHIQIVHMHAHKHAWNDGAVATARWAVTDAGSPARLFRSTQSITFSTSNARTSLYPLPETPIPLNPPSPLPNIPQNSSWTTHLGRTWFYGSTLINTTECTTLKKFHATSQCPLA